MVKVADLEAYSPAFLLAQMFCFLIPKIKWSHKLNHKLLNIVLYPMSCEPKEILPLLGCFCELFCSSEGNTHYDVLALRPRSGLLAASALYLLPPL